MSVTAHTRRGKLRESRVSVLRLFHDILGVCRSSTHVPPLPADAPRKVYIYRMIPASYLSCHKSTQVLQNGIREFTL